MSDLTTIPSSTDRKDVLDQGEVMQSSQPFIDDEMARITNEREAHALKCIIDWCRKSDPESSEAMQPEINVHTDMIPVSTLDQWESELNNNGYIVVRSDDLFTVQLPA